jgi:hypothetical protein
VAFLYDVGLYPPVSDEQVVAELKRMRHVETVSCQPAVGGWDFVCDYQKQPLDGPPVRHREGIRTSWASRRRSHCSDACRRTGADGGTGSAVED